METEASKTKDSAEERPFSKTSLSVKSASQLSKFYTRDEPVMTSGDDNNDESDCSAMKMWSSKEDMYQLDDANTTYSEKQKNTECQEGTKRTRDDGDEGMYLLHQ